MAKHHPKKKEQLQTVESFFSPERSWFKKRRFKNGFLRVGNKDFNCKALLAGRIIQILHTMGIRTMPQLLAREPAKVARAITREQSRSAKRTRKEIKSFRFLGHFKTAALMLEILEKKGIKI